MPKIKVIFDSNIWVSLAMGGRIKQLARVLLLDAVRSYICQEIVSEFTEVINRPKVAKYINAESVTTTQYLMENASILHVVQNIIPILRDPKDDFLLALALEVQANYLISGDGDVLALARYQDTTIMSFTDFMQEMQNLELI